MFIYRIHCLLLDLQEKDWSNNSDTEIAPKPCSERKALIYGQFKVYRTDFQGLDLVLE